MRIRIIAIILAIMVAASSCTAAVFVKAPEIQTDPIQFDWDLDGEAEDYWYPNFTAEVYDNGGAWTARVYANQDSPDAGQGESTMKVTVDGDVICNNDTYLLVGTCPIPAEYADGEPHAVGVYVLWREGNETLWTGFIQS